MFTANFERTVGRSTTAVTAFELLGSITEAATSDAEAARLVIAHGTVRTHLSHIFAKLGVSSRAQLASGFTRRS